MPLYKHRHKPAWLFSTFRLVFESSALLTLGYLIISITIDIIVHEQLISLADLIYALLNGLFLFSVFFVTGDFFSEIDSDEVGLHVSFFWTKLTIRWEEIYSFIPLFHLPFMKNNMVLQTHKLTVLHRLFGILYSFSLAPSIIVSKGLTDCPVLEQRINLALKNNRQNTKIRASAS